MRKQFGPVVPNKGAAGVRVVAESGGRRLEAVSTGDGEFEFLNLAPGKWTVRADSPGIANIGNAETVEVGQSGCAYASFSVSDDGRISGVVRNTQGVPLPDVPVQAFVFDANGDMDRSVFREGKTDMDGRYAIGGLPAREYAIGVNGERYHDSLAYAPVFYGGTTVRESAARIQLAVAEGKAGVDLSLGSPRAPVAVVLEAVDETGNLLQATSFSASDLSGTQRASVTRLEKSQTDPLQLTLWAGESYTLEAGRFAVHSLPSIDGYRAAVEVWEGTANFKVPAAKEVRIRVVLYRR